MNSKMKGAYDAEPIIRRENGRIHLPGFATAHSHAFQRALRGRTQRKATQAGSFWSWRGLMYDLAARLDPEDVYHISRFAFIELTMSGVTAVGEFHYLHHDTNGAPYNDRLTMADAVIDAARAAGIRISLIRAAYLRGGYRQPLEAAQRRFSDERVDEVLADVAKLRRTYEGNSLVSVGVAAHSVRAVPREAIAALADYAREHQLPFHMHVAEQRREVEECLAEHGKRPLQFLADLGVVESRFVAIHVTHLSEDEIKIMGAANAYACLCRTTERDLGDGLPQTAALLDAGSRLCVGVDSHAHSDAFEEIRAVELDDRSRTEARHVVAGADQLLTAATRVGYEAIGLGASWQMDTTTLHATDASVAGISEEWLADAVIFAATPRAVDSVTVAGKQIVANGRHVDYEDALHHYLKTLEKLGLKK